MDRKKLMAIDGNSLMHRAFYAIPLLTNKKGLYTNAVYGFTNMLLRLLREYNPDYVGVAFDHKAPTFRHGEYSQYKGTRQKTPEELIPQFDILKELLKVMNIAIYEKEGYEADDILGTFARIAEEKGLDALLVTGDRDALQLVSSFTTVLITRKGISDIQVFDPDAVQREYGITPSQIVDLKALMGDSSDNIPGVPGIGEKTALKLLGVHPTVEEVLDHVDDFSGKKLRENLVNYREQALLSKKLATIIKDAPVDIDLKDCCYDIPKTPELKDCLIELEFHSILSKLELGEEATTTQEDTRNKDEVKVTTPDEIAGVAESLNGKEEIAVLIGEDITLAMGSGKVFRIVLKKNLLDDGIDYQQAMVSLKPLLEDLGIPKVVHDGKKMISEGLQYGIDIKGIVFDTFIAAYLLEPTRNKYDLEQLVYDYLNLDVAAGDAEDLLKLAQSMREQLKATGMQTLYQEVEHPLIQVLADMERTGFKVNMEILRELDGEFSKRLDELTHKIHELAGEEFNINSSKQLGAILFDKLKLPIVKRTKTGYSTDVEVLEKLKGHHDIVDKIIEYRQVMKLKSTYIDGLLNVINPKDGRIHSSFNQTVTATGRISSTEPNLQNIPVRLEMGRQIRRVFVASDEDHVLVDADYSQIELRVLAHISGDPTFIEAFKKRQDIHRRTASEIFNVPLDQVTPEQRSSAKAVNFGIVYGISDYGLARNLGISRDRARKYIDSYLSRYPGIKDYMERIVKEGKEKGYVTTLMGRRRNLPELQSRNYNIRSFGERVAMNTPIQGTAADIIKKAMNGIYYELDKRGLKSKLILQVHDELIIDTYKPELEEVMEIVKGKMENAVNLSVPLVVDIGVGESWYDAK